MHPEVDEYFNRLSQWQDALEKLRAILLDCQLIETLKWNNPCYTYQDCNVAIIATLKDCCVLSFFKGALLQDTHGILAAPGENTRSARVVRFISVQEVNALASVLTAYIHEAIAIERAGRKVFPVTSTAHNVPTEFASKLQDHPDLKKAFNTLTPGRQRGYLLYFSQPKQSKTRAARVAQCISRILAGKGLND